MPAFRRPESKNAANTLVWMGLILGTLFMGVQILAHHLGPYPSEKNTVMSQLGGAVWGTGTFMYVVLQFATAAILTLAANTAYADFPRLSSIIARDGYLPKQLANRGDRLVFSNGVLVLALSASLLLIAFGGLTNALIPLYAVGVFLSFTLSQAGMVRHHQKERERGYKRNIVINAVGSVATLIVLLIVGGTKFTSGAWVPLVVIPLIVLLFKSIKRHYRTVSDGLRVTPEYKPRRMNHTMVVLVSGVHRGVLEALAYARSVSPNHLVAVSVVSDEEEQEKLEQAWTEYGIDVPLEIVYSPVPGAHPPDPPLHRRARRPLGERHHHRAHPGVRGDPLVGEPPARAERPAPEGPAPVPEGHRGDVTAVPPGVAGADLPHRSPKIGLLSLPPHSVP